MFLHRIACGKIDFRHLLENVNVWTLKHYRLSILDVFKAGDYARTTFRSVKLHIYILHLMFFGSFVRMQCVCSYVILCMYSMYGVDPCILCMYSKHIVYEWTDGTDGTIPELLLFGSISELLFILSQINVFFPEILFIWTLARRGRNACTFQEIPFS